MNFVGDFFALPQEDGHWRSNQVNIELAQERWHEFVDFKLFKRHCVFLFARVIKECLPGRTTFLRYEIETLLKVDKEHSEVVHIVSVFDSLFEF